MGNKNIAIVLAAGQGKRMKTNKQKQFLELAGKPLLYYSLKCFQESPTIDEIVLVTGQEEIAYCQSEIVDKYKFDKVTKVIAGGKERYHSVYEGLKACEDCKLVFIHDGARPFIDEGIIKRTKEAAENYHACVAAVKSKDTVKLSDEQDFVKETPKREQIWIVQTPQVFEYHLAHVAYGKCIAQGLENITDDAMVIEAMTSYKVKLIEGDYRNIKITTPEDLEIAKILVESC